MLVLGLTGSIGMGKSEVARMFRSLGVPVFDADAAVHALYDTGGAAVPAVERRFPETVKAGSVDRKALAARVLGDAQALRDLEDIVHPLVRRAEKEFLDAARAGGAKLAVLEIPLLFESGTAGCDKIAVVSAPEEVRRSRVLARPGMNEMLLAAISARQMPDAEKRRRADYVIPTGVSLEETLQAVKNLVRMLTVEVG
jgi:dephospho-CoA kinase